MAWSIIKTDKRTDVIEELEAKRAKLTATDAETAQQRRAIEFALGELRASDKKSGSCNMNGAIGVDAAGNPHHRLSVSVSAAD